MGARTKRAPHPRDGEGLLDVRAPKLLPLRAYNGDVSPIGQFITATYGVFAMAAPFLLIGFALAGVAHVLLPTGRARRWLGRRGWRGVVRASLLGLPLPLCSCSVIPVATALRKQGAGKGATTSFLISTPQTGVDSIAITYALLDPIMTLFRPIASLISALVGGMAVDAVNPDRIAAAHEHADPGEICEHCAHTDEEGRTPAGGARGGIRQALRFGFADVVSDTFWPLAIGFILSGLIAAVLPDDFFGRYVGNETLAVVLMLLVGLPFYVCASASTPIAAVLIAKGLSPGAAMVFLLAGPATNVTTMLMVKAQLGGRSLAAYLASVAVTAVVMGLTLNGIYHAFFGGRWPMAVGDAGEHVLPPVILHGSAIVLAWILLAAGAGKARAALARRGH